MHLRIYDLEGKTLGRATLDRPFDQKALVQRMRKGQLFFGPWEEPKPAAAKTGADKTDPKTEAGAGAGKGGK